MSDSEAPYGFQDAIERQLLGQLLLLRKGLTGIRSWLRPDHFCEPVHRGIFETIVEVFDRSGSSAMPLVAKALPDRLREDIARRAGVPAAEYLARATADATADIAYVEKAGRAVLEQWARIQIAMFCEEAAEALRDPLSDPRDVASRLSTSMEDTLNELRGSGGRRPRAMIGEVAGEVMKSVRDAMEGRSQFGIPWGPLSDIDRMTGGMQRSNLIVIGARPGMGKTSVALSIALGAARKGHGVGFLSLEMPKEELALRALSELTNGDRHKGPVPYSMALRRKGLTEGQFGQFEASRDHLRDYPIEIDDGEASTANIRAKIEGIIERFARAGRPRLDVLIIDHLDLIAASSAYRGNRTNEIGEITRALKILAKEFDIALVLLSQLSREVEKREGKAKRPQLSDLRNSGNIEQDADLVALLFRESYYIEQEAFTGEREVERLDRLDACRNQLDFIIAKARQGRTGTVTLWCDMGVGAVRNLERDA